MRENRHERIRTCPWLMEPRDCQFGDLHLLCIHFFKPQTPRDWRSFSAFSAFLVAPFAEMYGFPLPIYFLPGWLQSRFPDVDWFSHDAGHLLEMMFGWKTNPHAGPFHILSFVFIGGGFILISGAWKVLYDAKKKRRLGFLLQWPTILTLAMFPVLTVMYVKLARTEEQDARREFSDVYARYAAQVPGFIPKFSRILDHESAGGYGR